MATLFSDNFNRANSATVDATNWTENGTGNWDIVSNKVRCSSTGRALCTTTSAHAAVADCKVSYKRALTGTSWDTGVLARTNSTGTTGYFLDPIGTGAGGTMDIWRIDGPAISNDTQIGSTVTGITLADGDVYMLEISGTGATVTLKGYVNGVLKITVTDSSGSRITAAGQTGIINWGAANNDFDDFLVEDIAAAGAALTGQAIASAAGTLVPAPSIALTGSSLASALGTLVPATSKALSGSALTISRGTLAPALAKALSGSVITLGQGTITVQGDVTLALTGQAITSALGTLIPQLSIVVTGQVLTLAQTTIVPTTAPVLSGVALSGAAGTDVPALSISLNGQLVTIGQGTLSAPGNVSRQLTGQDLTFALGVLVPALSKVATGSALASALGIVIPDPRPALSGVLLTGATGTMNSSASVSMTGSLASFGQGVLSTDSALSVPPIYRQVSVIFSGTIQVNADDGVPTVNADEGIPTVH